MWRWRRRNKSRTQIPRPTFLVFESLRQTWSPQATKPNRIMRRDRKEFWCWLLIRLLLRRYLLTLLTLFDELCYTHELISWTSFRKVEWNFQHQCLCWDCVNGEGKYGVSKLVYHLCRMRNKISKFLKQYYLKRELLLFKSHSRPSGAKRYPPKTI